MGNLRDKYTNEEWGELIKTLNKKHCKVGGGLPKTPTKIKEKDGIVSTTPNINTTSAGNNISFEYNVDLPPMPSIEEYGQDMLDRWVRSFTGENLAEQMANKEREKMQNIFNKTTEPTDKPNTPHYNSKKIQPIEYIIANELDFCEGNVVKYITRYKEKNGLEDLLKAKDYLERIIKNYK